MPTSIVTDASARQLCIPHYPCLLGGGIPAASFEQACPALSRDLGAPKVSVFNASVVPTSKPLFVRARRAAYRLVLSPFGVAIPPYRRAGFSLMADGCRQIVTAYAVRLQPLQISSTRSLRSLQRR